MQKGRFQVKNDTEGDMIFQIEPDCWTFTLKTGELAVVEYDYDEEPTTLQFTDPVHGGIHGAIIPGDGDVQVQKEGENVLDGI